MGRYSHEPDNATKSCKARGSNLRVHFKVRLIDYVFVKVEKMPKAPKYFGEMIH